MSQYLFDLNESLVILALARKKCIDDSPYGWERLFRAGRHIEKQIDNHFKNLDLVGAA